MSRIEERVEQKARDRMTGRSYELTVSDDQDIVRLCRYVRELREDIADARKWMIWVIALACIVGIVSSISFGLWLQCGGM
jgi:hypothetical protein